MTVQCDLKLPVHQICSVWASPPTSVTITTLSNFSEASSSFHVAPICDTKCVSVCLIDFDERICTLLWWHVWWGSRWCEGGNYSITWPVPSGCPNSGWISFNWSICKLCGEWLTIPGSVQEMTECGTELQGLVENVVVLGQELDSMILRYFSTLIILWFNDFELQSGLICQVPVCNTFPESVKYVFLSHNKAGNKWGTCWGSI